MQILNNDYWNSYMKPYVADVGVALAFGVGAMLFKSFKKDDPNFSKNIKETIKKIITKWDTARTIQKFNSLIINNTDKKTDAYKILKTISEAEVVPDIVTYNCLIYMSFQLGQSENAYKLYEELADFTFPIQPDIVTYNILFKGLVKEVRENENKSQSKNIEFLEKINKYKAEIETRKLAYDDFTFNTIIDAYVECGELDLAWEVYEQMKTNSKDVKSQEVTSDESQSEESPAKILRPDVYTYTTLIKGLKNNHHDEKNLDKILEIFDNIKTGKVEGLKLDEFLVNSVLDACIKYEKQEQAMKIFKEMNQLSLTPSVITYSIILKGFSNQGKLEESIEFYNLMKIANVKPNEVVYDCLLNCAIKCQRIDMMKDIYENMKQDKISPNGVIYSTLVKGFNRTKKYDLAFQLYDSLTPSQMEKTDIVFFNALLDCCVEANYPEKMNQYYETIKTKAEDNEGSFSPTVITYSTLLKGYTKFNEHEKAISLYKQLIGSEMYVDEVFFNTMADYYAKQKNSKKALEILKEMKEANVIRSSVIYSILIKLFSSLGDEQKAINTYDDMKKDGLKPTLITYTTMMQMFIKLKKLDQAINVFYEMRKNKINIDVVTYNFIINGCSFNKRLETAIELLDLSFTENVKLSDNTYSNVLDYITSNKFMKINERCQYAGNILQKLKENNITVKYEVYSKVMKMMYQVNERSGAKEIEKFSKFSNLKKEGGQSQYQETSNRKFPNNQYKTYNNFSNNNNYSKEESSRSIYSESKESRSGNGFNRSGRYNN